MPGTRWLTFDCYGTIADWNACMLGALQPIAGAHAASLLAARAPSHPFALLIGLNLGPNLFVSGSLAWLLWFRAAKAAGAHPSVARASRIGSVAVPLAMAAALGLLVLSGTS